MFDSEFGRPLAQISENEKKGQDEEVTANHRTCSSNILPFIYAPLMRPTPLESLQHLEFQPFSKNLMKIYDPLFKILDGIELKSIDECNPWPKSNDHNSTRKNESRCWKSCKSSYKHFSFSKIKSNALSMVMIHKLWSIIYGPWQNLG